MNDIKYGGVHGGSSKRVKRLLVRSRRSNICPDLEFSKRLV